jgi:hypothetical protein
MAEDEWAQAMLEWAINAPPAELAAELMAAFGQGTELTPQKLVQWLLRGGSSRASMGPLLVAIKEAVQLLEHAELVYVSRMTDSANLRITWEPTRVGLATLGSGKDAVRQRIKERTGL